MTPDILTGAIYIFIMIFGTITVLRGNDNA